MVNISVNNFVIMVGRYEICFYNQIHIANLRIFSVSTNGKTAGNVSDRGTALLQRKNYSQILSNCNIFICLQSEFSISKAMVRLMHYVMNFHVSDI